MDSEINESAIILNSEYHNLKAFRNVMVVDSVFGNGCSIGDDSSVERCVFENNVIVNRRSYINDSFIGKYSYSGINTTINWAKIGRFCSLARNVDIGGFDHDYHKVTTMPEFRFAQMLNGGGRIPQKDNYNEWCEIGNDVWIAAGAQILHKIKIGNGAVIGAGAVVTHDVPPYAIVVGVPAKIIGYRCEKQMIDKLLEIKWWDWPEGDIRKNYQLLIHQNISFESIDKLQMISAEIKQRIRDDNEK